MNCLRAVSCELGLKETQGSNREHSKQGECWVAPLMAGQMPVVVVSLCEGEATPKGRA